MMYEMLKDMAHKLLEENAEHVTIREIWSQGEKFTHHTIWKNEEMIEVVYDSKGHFDKIQVFVGKR